MNEMKIKFENIKQDAFCAAINFLQENKIQVVNRSELKKIIHTLNSVNDVKQSEIEPLEYAIKNSNAENFVYMFGYAYPINSLTDIDECIDEYLELINAKE